MQEIYGGSNEASSHSLNISTGTDALLSLNYEWSQGDKSYKWNLEVGKNVHADVNLLNIKQG